MAKRKVTKSKRVHKALSPEEKTIADNIMSLAQELMAGGGEEDEVIMSEDEMPDYIDDEGDEEDEVAKESNGQTANPSDKAEDRVEDPTDITAGNLSEVGKSLAILSRAVKTKKAKTENTMIMKSLAGIAQAMKSLANQTNNNNMAIQNILDGIGFADNVEVSNAIQKSAKKPIANLDGNAVLLELANVLKGIQTGTPVVKEIPFSEVRKNSRDALRDSLPALFNVRK